MATEKAELRQLAPVNLLQALDAIAMFIYRAIKFRSISHAKWVWDYEHFTPDHGK